jgi:hypothetical protein
VVRNTACRNYSSHSFNSSRTDGDFCHQGQDPQKLAKRLSEPADMTIHWKALEEHFLMVLLVFQFNHFWGKMHFLNLFTKKSQSLKSYAGDPPGSRQAYDSFATSSQHIHDKKSQPVDQLQFCLRHVHDLFTTRSRQISTQDSFATGLTTRSNMFDLVANES